MLVLTTHLTPQVPFVSVWTFSFRCVGGRLNTPLFLWFIKDIELSLTECKTNYASFRDLFTFSFFHYILKNSCYWMIIRKAKSPPCEIFQFFLPTFGYAINLSNIWVFLLIYSIKPKFCKQFLICFTRSVLLIFPDL